MKAAVSAPTHIFAMATPRGLGRYAFLPVVEPALIYRKHPPSLGIGSRPKPPVADRLQGGEK